MKDQKKNVEFKGSIQFVSVSPHGDPEGVVLDDGTFIKIPPHSLHAKERFESGANISGSGEQLMATPNRVIHHAKVFLGKVLLADDSVDKDVREDLKDQHKKELKRIKDAPAKEIKLRGKVVAIGVKPKGEVDRLILADGTTVHVPKEIELFADGVEIGGEVEVTGESRTFDQLRFVRAESARFI